MSLPDDTLASLARPAGFLPPDNITRYLREPPLTPGAREPIVDFEQGGAAVGDASQGLRVQDWRVRVEGDDVLLSEDPYIYDQVVFSEPGITEVSLAFDQNMSVTVAYVAGGQAKLRWYDPLASGIVTSNLAPDVRSPFVTLDDKRPFTFSLSDILLFYFRGATLYYRQQRERYLTERSLRTFNSDQVWITRLGMNRNNRLQLEFGGPGRTPLP